MPSAAPPGSNAADEIEQRRLHVVRLRNQQKSIYAIAKELGASASTISRDLDWIRKHWRDQFGRSPSIDPGEIVGETLSVYRESERLLFEEYVTLGKLDYSVGAAKVRVMAIEAASRQRERYMNLLMDLGVLDRATASRNDSGTHATPVLRAADMRRLISGATVSDDMLIPEIERQAGAMPGDVIDVTPEPES